VEGGRGEENRSITCAFLFIAWEKKKGGFSLKTGEGEKGRRNKKKGAMYLSVVVCFSIEKGGRRGGKRTRSRAYSKRPRGKKKKKDTQR